MTEQEVEEKTKMSADILVDLLAKQQCWKQASDAYREDRNSRTLREMNAAVQQHADLKSKAIKRFADLNGWTRTEKSFGPDHIGRAQSDYNFSIPRWMDHPLFFRKRRAGRQMSINAAMVGQPYQFDPKELNHIADRLGLKWYATPKPYASFHYPENTYLVVMTTADHVMRWLPEQETGV